MAEVSVLFKTDTLHFGALGRNGFMKTKGLVVAEESDPGAIPEVPYITLTPINSKGEVTETCLLRWPMSDTTTVIDGVLDLHGFSLAKRRAVAGLLADETDPCVDLKFDEPTPVTAKYADTRIAFEQDKAGGVRVDVFVGAQRIHSFAATAKEIDAIKWGQYEAHQFALFSGAQVAQSRYAF